MTLAVPVIDLGGADVPRAIDRACREIGFLIIGNHGVPQATIDYMVSRIPKGRTGRPEEIAALVHYLASAEASFTTGQCYDISGGRATY